MIVVVPIDSNEGLTKDSSMSFVAGCVDTTQYNTIQNFLDALNEDYVDVDGSFIFHVE